MSADPGAPAPVLAAPVLVEACVDTVESALAAQAGGAARVELCDDLVEGGTTPSAGTIAVARERLRIALVVLVRPRAGDFLYSDDEMAVMRRDIAVARELGADGVALGALTPEGDVDVERTRALIEAARPMRVTFHRAFDLTRDPRRAIEALEALGVDRVLTSGAAPTAVAGIPMLAWLVRRGRAPTILAGGGITGESAPRIVRETGVRELHVRAAARVNSAMRHRRGDITFGKPHEPSEYSRLVTDAARVRAIVEACGSPLAPPPRSAP
jgi:copper homeostasis protein